MQISRVTLVKEESEGTGFKVAVGVAVGALVAFVVVAIILAITVKKLTQ